MEWSEAGAGEIISKQVISRKLLTLAGMKSCKTQMVSVTVCSFLSTIFYLFLPLNKQNDEVSILRKHQSLSLTF